MLSMERADFAKFFASVNDGHSPFAWQERLLDTLLENGRWPNRIAAPTGAGKTSAIDVHAFAVALTGAAGGGPRLPRRLAMVVDRRVLVDDQYVHARALAQALAEPKDDVIEEVAGRLAALRWPDSLAGTAAVGVGLPSPLMIGRMRGGSVPSRTWRDHPTACAVLCATPDMWGSRVLFRGYGTSDRAAAREAGLLAFDAAVLVDEAHLSRQLLVTARQVSRLSGVAERPITSVPALQVVEVSATPASDSGQAIGQPNVSVTVNEGDLAEESLAARLTRPKPVTLLPVKEWPSARQPGKAAAAAADAAMAMLRPPSDDDAAVHTIGCFVNTVPMAIAVADALRRRFMNGRALRVVMVCGQIRPADVDRLTSRYPGILTPQGNSDVDVIVATQSLEVGADLDLAGIVTELAAGSALAQRAGRANRRGKRGQAPVTVLVPGEPISERTRSGPYSHEELAKALAWVNARAAHPDGLAPWALQEHPPPDARPRRVLYQRPELADAWHWARTSDELAAEPELSLWLAESLDEETSVGLVVRDALPVVPAEAVEFVRDLPPVSREVFPVPYRTAQTVLAELLAAGGTLVRVRGEDVAPLPVRVRADGSHMPDMRPGDVLVIDSALEIFTPSGDAIFSPPVVVPPASGDELDGIEPSRRAPADDVLHLQADLGPGDVVLRLESSPQHERVAGLDAGTARRVLDQFADGFDERTERDRRDHLADLLQRWPDDQLGEDLRHVLDAVVKLLRGPVKQSEVMLRRTGEKETRAVVVDRRRAAADEDLRQVFTTRDPAVGLVLLADHQAHVAGRAGMIAEGLGLAEALAGALRLAGAHHDDGKADPRFQAVRLGAKDGDPLLAKSDPRSTVRQVRERQAQAGLPSRWRHEQRSVVDSWDTLHAAVGVDPVLTARLVGTSHGYGRSGFPHTAEQLAGEQHAEDWLQRATSLFDHGGWDEFIETTQIRYGVWGCAFLEALLRAADCQVSGEGG